MIKKIKRRIPVKPHFRKVKRKRVRIRRHSRRIKAVGFIPSKDRKVFNILSSKEFRKEKGGYLDFGKKGTGALEEYSIATGKASEIDLPADWEAVWHSHPSYKRKTFEALGSPSSEDMVALIKTPKIRASVIFHKGNAYSVIKTPQSRKLAKMSPMKIRERYDIDDEDELTQQLRKDGFIIRKSKKGKKLILPIKVIE